MTNHVHLLLTPEYEEGPSLLMKNLGQRYVQRVNALYERSGTLWDGRFKSCLAQDDHYALCCYRYIELNPVRAGMVSSPDLYNWSSFRFNGLGMPCDFLSPHPHYIALGMTPDERCSNYRELVAATLQETVISEIRVATQGNYVVGATAFKKHLAAGLGRRVEAGYAGRPRLN
jgi:putative transposase